MIKCYRIKDICVTTYDGYTFKMELDGIFNGPRMKIEDTILNALRPKMRNDIPVSATFKMIPV